MLSEDDLVYLRRVIELARETRLHGNHPFGALLVSKDGKILAEAGNLVFTSRDPTAHAELNLASMAGKSFSLPQLQASTMYCSTEPCPMCAGAIHWSGIGRVVYALSQERLYQFSSEASEDKPLRLSCRDVFSKCARIIEVEGPALENEAAAVHDGFWK